MGNVRQNAHRNKKIRTTDRHAGFTLIELIVVIVIIAILAAIIVVTYMGLIQRSDKTVLTSDLVSGAKLLKSYEAVHGSYPTSLDGNNCPALPTADTAFCLKLSNGTSLESYTGTATTFMLQEGRSSSHYQIPETMVISEVAAPAVGQPTIAPTSVSFDYTNGGYNVTVPTNTGPVLAKIRFIQHHPVTTTCTKTYEETLATSPSNTTIKSYPSLIEDKWTGSCASGYLGDVPTDVFFLNSYGSGPVYSFVDFFE